MAIGRMLFNSFYWKCLQFLSSFLLNILLARTMRSAVAGEFYSLIYWFALCVSFFTLGLDIALNVFISRKQLSPRFACRIIGVVVLLALLVCVPLVWLYAGPSRYPDLYGTELPLYAACQIAGSLLTVLSSTLFTARGRNDIPSRVGFFFNLVLAIVIGAVLLSGRGEWNMRLLFLLYFSFSLLQGLGLFLLAMRNYGRENTGITGHARLSEMLSFSFKAFVTNFVFFLGARVCLYLLPYRFAPGDKGNFIQAYKLVEYLGMAAAFFYYPFVALAAGENRRLSGALAAGEIRAQRSDGENADGMRRNVLAMVRLSNSIVLIFSIAIAACGWWLFPFVFGSSFDRMYPVFLCFIPGLLATCSSSFLTAYFFGVGSIRYNFISSCIQLIAAVILFLLLTRLYGLQGGALAYSAAALLSMGYDTVKFSRHTRLRARDFLLAGKKDWLRLLHGLGRFSGLSPDESAERLFYPDVEQKGDQ
jgi:O-antigen/teichoic acid export membrane protein